VLLAVYAAVVLSWTAYNWVRVREVVIGAQAYVVALWRAWLDRPQGLDAQLLEDAPGARVKTRCSMTATRRCRRYVRAISGTRSATRGGASRNWARVSPAARDGLFPGESVRSWRAAGSRRAGRLRGYSRAGADWFAPKLALYLFPTPRWRWASRNLADAAALERGRAAGRIHRLQTLSTWC